MAGESFVFISCKSMQKLQWLIVTLHRPENFDLPSSAIWSMVQSQTTSLIKFSSEAGIPLCGNGVQSQILFYPLRVGAAAVAALALASAETTTADAGDIMDQAGRQTRQDGSGQDGGENERRCRRAGKGLHRLEVWAGWRA